MTYWISPRVIRGNRGDLLSRWGILWSLSKAGGNEAIDVFCSKPTHLPSGCKGDRLRYGPLYNLIPSPAGWAALRRARAVVWTGGLDLQDDSSLLKLVHTVLTFGIYRVLGLRIVVLMQGAGPLLTPIGRVLARVILSLVDVFVARDAGTLELLKRLRTSTRLELGYDGIFLPGFGEEQAPARERERINALAGRSRKSQPLIGVNLRLWFHFHSGVIPFQFARERYRTRAAPQMRRFSNRMIEVIRALRETLDARIVLISMYEPESEPWEDDLQPLTEIKQAFVADDEVMLLTDDLSLPGFAELVGRLDLMIGTRLHSTLAAMRAGVPAIHLCYTLKGRDIFKGLGLGEQVIELEDFLVDSRPLLDLAQSSLSDRLLRNRVRAARDRAVARNTEIVARVVSDANSTSQST
jgi:polysaccharide pyruvyl transferase WcaK-like protein